MLSPGRAIAARRAASASVAGRSDRTRMRDTGSCIVLMCPAAGVARNGSSVRFCRPSASCYTDATQRQRGNPMNQHSTAAGTKRFFAAPLAETDPDLAAAIRHELDRQQDGIELIASENFVSAAVLEAQGSVLTNKYAEG